MESLPANFVSDNGFGKPSHRKNREGIWCETPPGYRLREDGFISHMSFGGIWYSVPDIEELEGMICDMSYTPEGDSVEPDHPRGWLRILGLI